MSNLDSIRNSFSSNPAPSHPNTPPPTEDEAEFDRLAELPPADYDRERKTAAKRLEIRPSTLDSEVYPRRKKKVANDNLSGTPLELTPPEPWEEEVNGADLLDEITGEVSKYLILPPGGAEAAALWVTFAHALDAFEIAPRLGFTSPEPGCGKTRSLSIVQSLTPCPLMASNLTPAAVFRAIDAAKPTLILDELDSFGEEREELRGILNSGHYLTGAYVVRVVGDDHEPRKFSTWCPIAYGMIGTPPRTLADRSIQIRMRRKSASETVHPLRFTGKAGEAISARLCDLSRKAARWAINNMENLKNRDPELPPSLINRSGDNWLPLLAIADQAGGHWPGIAREIALTLSQQEEETGLGVELLSDIFDIFQTERLKHISSAKLAEMLSELEDRPWGEWKGRNGFRPHALARLLKPYDIRSRTIRISPTDTPKGYTREDFTSAWASYLPKKEAPAEEPPTQNATPPQTPKNRLFPPNGPKYETPQKPPCGGCNNGPGGCLDCNNCTCGVVANGNGSIPAPRSFSDENGGRS